MPAPRAILGSLGRSCLCWLGHLAAPGGRSSHQDERGIVADCRADMPSQIVTQAFKQVWTDAVGAGRG